MKRLKRFVKSVLKWKILGNYSPSLLAINNIDSRKLSLREIWKYS